MTGCSSGIGRAVALGLAERGFLVFATVRKEADFQNLRALNQPNLTPVYPLDLSRPEHIPGVVKTIREELAARGKEGLYAIVNNAGGGFIAPVELMDLDKFRAEFETRVIGPMALAQAFLPLIRRAHGRILWITTPALIAIPYVASIHANEFAMNCIAQNLHIELTPWQIPNVMICCGGIQTPAPARTAYELEESMARWSPDQKTLYAEAIQRLQARLSRFDKGRTGPEEVAKVVFRALTARRPKRRYSIGSGSKAMSLLRFMPQSLIDAIFSKMA